MMTKNPFALTLAVFFLTLSACGSLVYRMNINQGNLIQQKDVDRLRPGLSKRFVILIMGTPAIQDPFNSDEWVYFNTVKDRYGEVTRKEMKVYFEDDQLVRIEGDYHPGGGKQKTAGPKPEDNDPGGSES